MDLDNFYKKLRTSIPVERMHTYFEEDLRETLTQYLNDVEFLDENVFNGKCSKDEVISLIKKQIDTIQEVVNI